jgi:hypothetical protein
MMIHIIDEREIGGDDPGELLGGAIELGAHRRLDLAQGGRNGSRDSGRGAHRATRSSARMRSATSRNWMSTAKTR